MARVWFSLFFWLLLIGSGVLIGERYGAPGWLVGLAEPAFTRAEDAIGGRISPQNDAGQRDSEPAAGSAGDLSMPLSTAAPAGETPANANLRMNDAGIQIIKDSEGLRLEAYSAGGRSYIGYGHQMRDGEPRRITESQAEALLRQDLRSFESGVRSRLMQPATRNQFSAMVSLAYNLGLGGFSRSSVLEKFNAGDVNGAADAFRAHNRGGGVVLQHLVERREKERALFLTPDR